MTENALRLTQYINIKSNNYTNIVVITLCVLRNPDHLNGHIIGNGDGPHTMYVVRVVECSEVGRSNCSIHTAGVATTGLNTKKACWWNVIVQNMD